MVLRFHPVPLAIFIALSMAFTSPLWADDTIILSDGRELVGSIISMSEDTIVFYDKSANSQRRIPKASVVGGRFGETPLLSATGSQQLPQNNFGLPTPLIYLPFNNNFENIGSALVEIESKGNIPFGDDPAGTSRNSIVSTGSGNYIRIASNPKMNTLSNFTVSFWFLVLDSNRTQHLVSKWRAAYIDTQTADGVFSIGYTKPGKLIIFLVDQDGAFHSYSVDKAIQERLSWNHVVVSFDSKQLNVYVNGFLFSSFVTEYELYQNNTSDILLLTAISREDSKDGQPGTEDLSSFNLIGQMDDFRLWDTSISAEAVKNLYRNTYDNLK